MTPARLVYRVSGKSLLSKSHTSINAFGLERFRFVSHELKSLVDARNEVVAVLGGGNAFRGSASSVRPMSCAATDEVGNVVADVNALLLGSVLKDMGVPARVLGRAVRGTGKPYPACDANGWLADGGVIVLAGDVGIPFVSSDYAAVHHAVHFKAGRVLVARSEPDGVYEAGPYHDNRARTSAETSCSTLMRTGIEAFDPRAIELATRFGIRIDVFSALTRGAGIRAMGDFFDDTAI